MKPNLAEAPGLTARPDPRKFERRRIPLRAKIADLKGTAALDCTICDISMVGAQINLSSAQPLPEALYLVDLVNGVAYRANLAWWRPHAAGLAFLETYPLSDDAPAGLSFLKQMVIEATLGEIDALTARGVTPPDTVGPASIAGATHAAWNSHSHHDSSLECRLWELERQIASLRALLVETSKN